MLQQQQLALGDNYNFFNNQLSNGPSTMKATHLLTKSYIINMVNNHFDNYITTTTTAVPIYLRLVPLSTAAIHPQLSYWIP